MLVGDGMVFSACLDAPEQQMFGGATYVVALDARTGKKWPSCRFSLQKGWICWMINWDVRCCTLPIKKLGLQSKTPETSRSFCWVFRSSQKGFSNSQVCNFATNPGTNDSMVVADSLSAVMEENLVGWVIPRNLQQDPLNGPLNLSI